MMREDTVVQYIYIYFNCGLHYRQQNGMLVAIHKLKLVNTQTSVNRRSAGFIYIYGNARRRLTYVIVSASFNLRNGVFYFPVFVHA